MSSSFPSSTPGKPWQPPTPEALAPELPAYEIECLLGRGGMGAVYKAKQKSLQRDVAIKVLPPTIEDNDMHYVERFKAEAQSMAKLNHPGIIAVYDAGETPSGLLYFVMEYVQGTDVQQMISSSGRLPQAHAHAIAASVCDALAYAHSNGLIHRDIKPANIMVDMQGRVKVADFGLAKSVAENTGFTQSNMAVGTPDFVAPESLVAGMPVDGRADLYAVGVMIYQMLTGNVPRGAWHPPSVLLPGEIDPRFDQIVVKAMQVDRDHRHGSAMEMRAHLDSLLMPMVPAPDLQRYSSVGMAKQAALPSGPTAPPPEAKPKPGAPSKPQAPVAAPQGQSGKPKIFIGLGAAAAAVIAFVVFGGSKPAPLEEKPASAQSGSGITPAQPSPASTTTKTEPPPTATKPVASTSTPVVQPSAGGLKPETTSPPAAPAPMKDESHALAPSVNYTFPLQMPGRPTRSGQVVVWRLDGKPFSPEDEVMKPPADVTDAVQIAAFNTASLYHAVILRADGTLRSIGPSDAAANKFPSGTRDVVRVFVAGSRGMALKTSGEFVNWGGAQPSVTPEKLDIIRSARVVDLVAVSGIDVALLDSGAAVSLRNGTIDAAIKKTGRCAMIAGSAGGSTACVTDDGMLTWIGGDKAKNELGAQRHPFLQKPASHFVIFDNTSGDAIAFTSTGEIAGVYGSNAFKSRIAGMKGLTDAIAFNGIHALRINGEWKFEAAGDGASVGLDTQYCDTQAKECFALTLTDRYAFGIKPAATPAAPLVSTDSKAPTDSATVPGPAPTMQKSEVEQRLDALAEQFKAAFAKAAGAAHTESVGKLNQQFIGALQRQQAAAQAAGKLDDLVILKAETERMTASPSIPELDDDSTPALLKPLHETYRKALAPLVAERDKKAEPVLKTYLQSLAVVQSELTKAGKVDDALRVKSLIESLGNSDAEDVNATVAAKAPGKDEAAPPFIPPLSRKPGKLKAWGDFRNGAMDLTKAAKYSDFVQVGLTGLYWFALRASGDLVSSNPFHDGLKGVLSMKLEGNSAMFITKKGVVANPNNVQETIEPTSWGGGRLRDAAVSYGGVGLFVREDGTVRLRDTKSRKGKPAITPNKAHEMTRAIQNATQAVAAGGFVFALTADGKVVGWAGPKWDQDKVASREVAAADLTALPSGVKAIAGLTGSGVVTLAVVSRAGDYLEFSCPEGELIFTLRTANNWPPNGSANGLVRQGITSLKSGTFFNAGSSKAAIQLRTMRECTDVALDASSFKDAKLGQVANDCILWIE